METGSTQHKTQDDDVPAPFAPDDFDMKQVLMLRVFRTLPGNAIKCFSSRLLLYG